MWLQFYEQAGLGVLLTRAELSGMLLGIQPPFTTSLFWRLVKAAVLARHLDGLTTCS